jgi:OmpA-OmpF porin, OOP family
MKRNLSLVVGLMLCSFSYAQQQIYASGKVIDSRTNKGIRAQIQYSSIPTGSLSGKFNDSTFSFEIFGTARYKVTASAAGYSAKTVIIDPKNLTTDGTISQVITLTPKGETIVLNHLIFDQGKSSIQQSSYLQLDEVVRMMKDNTKMIIQLEGHTDNQGDSKANMELSQERVDAVKKYLVKQGIPKDRIKTKAFGGSQPLRNEMTQEDRAKNRRVEMRILKE